MRSLLVVVFIIFLTSCSSKLAYNNLDWWVYWYMDDYIELKDEQEEKFDAHLQNWLSWHKKSELTRYKAQLEDIKKQIQNDTFNSSIVYNNLELARSHWERVRDEVSPELAAIAKTLDDEQVVTLFAALEKGITSLGHTVDYNTDDCDIPVIWSVLWNGRMAPNEKIFKTARDQGKDVLVLEVGGLKRGTTWKVGLNGINREAKLSIESTA